MSEQDRQLLVRALENAANAILITDRQGRIVWVNQSFARLSGYSHDELLGQSPGLLRSGKQSEAFYADLWQTILAGRPWQGELVERNKAGERYTVNQVITPLCDESGVITHFLAIQHHCAIADHEREQMLYLALHDSLTGLPNRSLFLDLLAQAQRTAALHGGKLAVMFVDLDGFKQVNDRFGHACGDKLLVAVAGRLRKAVRKSDVVARLSGDEFVVLLPQVDTAESIERLGRKLLDSVARPYKIDQRRLGVSASLGISFYPDDACSADVLLARADAAMYWAKASGGNDYRLA